LRIVTRLYIPINKPLKFDEDLHENGLKILEAVEIRKECERLLLDSELDWIMLVIVIRFLKQRCSASNSWIF